MGERDEVESDIAQLEELRQRAVDGGQIQWVHWIDGVLERRRKYLKEITDSAKRNKE